MLDKIYFSYLYIYLYLNLYLHLSMYIYMQWRVKLWPSFIDNNELIKKQNHGTCALRIQYIKRSCIAFQNIPFSDLFRKKKGQIFQFLLNIKLLWLGDWKLPYRKQPISWGVYMHSLWVHQKSCVDVEKASLRPVTYT